MLYLYFCTFYWLAWRRL